MSSWETRLFRARSSTPMSAWPEPRSFRFSSMRAFAFPWSSSRFWRCFRASPAKEAAVLECSERRADLSLRLVDEISLLAEELRHSVQGVALLEETLELDLRLIEFRKGFLPDHRVPRQDGMQRLTDVPLTFRHANGVGDAADLLRR